MNSRVDPPKSVEMVDRIELYWPSLRASFDLEGVPKKDYKLFVAKMITPKGTIN